MKLLTASSDQVTSRRTRAFSFLAAIASVLVVPATGQAAFPGANGKISFTHTPTSGQQQIYAVNPGGSGQVNLSDNAEANFDPHWSPGGAQIAFTRTLPVGSRLVNDVFVTNANGGGQRDVTGGVAENDDCAPVCQEFAGGWSPDANRILFRDDSGGIFTIGALGTGLARIVDVPFSFDPTPSPNGRWIAFSKTDGGACGDIWIMSSDGTDQVNLTNTPGVCESGPDWSPDGQRIAFSAYSDTSGATADVFAMRQDGSNVTRLTNDSANDTDPAWSPDGTKIVFSSTEARCSLCSDITVMRSDGSGVTRLTHGALDNQPDWQPLQFKNTSKWCKAFPGGYRNHGQCVKANHRFRER